MPRLLLAGLAGVAIAGIAIGAVSAANRAAARSNAAGAESERTAPSSRAVSRSSGLAPSIHGAVPFDPGSFVPGAPIDNVYFPLPVGRVLVYRGVKDGQTQRDVVRVTARTRMIAGVLATAVSDIAKHGKTVLERTTDYYAQDKVGNVWYLGEATVSFGPHGRRDTSGSWMAGVNGAIPGLIMEADPRIPDAYRQEFLTGEAEDTAWVVRRGGSISVPFRKIRHKLSTLEATRVEPGAYDLKVYGPGLGIVLERALSGPPEVAKLVSVTGP
jgi:hypothetical protein